MAQKTEKEETELQVPETLTLRTPSIRSETLTSNLSASDDRISSPEISDLKSGISRSDNVDSRSTSLKRSDLHHLHRKSSFPAVEVSEHDCNNNNNNNNNKRREVNRCSGCRRKVGLTGFRCRCGEMFCSDHRYSDRHDCSYDYKAAGREAIARENPVVRAAKILKV